MVRGVGRSFFFQAEDGIRDYDVTGVQTCALPILSLSLLPLIAAAQEDLTTILQRGYPAQWFVCGPFESDLDQGIIEAVANAQAPRSDATISWRHAAESKTSAPPTASK